MTLDLTDHERDFLLEVLETMHPEMQHELHHTDAHEYRAFLKGRIDMLEHLTAKIVKLAPAPAPSR